MKKEKLNFKKGQLKVNITPTFAEITTIDKEWSVRFGKQTKEYVMLQYFMLNKDKESLEGLMVTSYYTRLVLVNDVMLKKFLNLLEETFDIEASQISKEDDDKILKEEEMLHENK